ncbi:MCE family protein [Antrihabitans sp. YC2-6]|uniref:MCE family protein n=1 Tax=Antrihabitans sp. YC2-6 TaxID=2799498 RepID=UPI0018F446FF|nr:MCE family protein [Antrihabitans sp. YC2-6]MBJ8345764.1 MCE family protein [Antrihabitans sp. YC2-6]
MKNTATTVKLTIFALIMAVIFAGLVIVFSQARFASTSDYHATFVSSSGLREGNKVRIAGVPVGSVTGVEVGRDNLAHIDFDVESKYELLKSTRATIRYENLVGDRYVELLDSPGSIQEPLGEGGTIPVEQTQPALDLDQLLGGFKPLLQGLDPTQINDLTEALVQVFQGQGETLVSLLNSTGSFSKTLADRDEMIGSVIDNLNTVLKTIDDRGDQFSTTVDQLQQLISALAVNRDPIADSIPRIARATSQLEELLSATRPDIAGTIEQTGRLATNLDAGSASLEDVLAKLPETFRRLIRLGGYGSFFQFYVCNTKAKFSGPDGREIVLQLPAPQLTGRCAPS